MVSVSYLSPWHTSRKNHSSASINKSLLLVQNTVLLHQHKGYSSIVSNYPHHIRRGRIRKKKDLAQHKSWIGTDLLQYSAWTYSCNSCEFCYGRHQRRRLRYHLCYRQQQQEAYLEKKISNAFVIIVCVYNPQSCQIFICTKDLTSRRSLLDMILVTVGQRSTPSCVGLAK